MFEGIFPSKLQFRKDTDSRLAQTIRTFTSWALSRHEADKSAEIQTKYCFSYSF